MRPFWEYMLAGAIGSLVGGLWDRYQVGTALLARLTGWFHRCIRCVTLCRCTHGCVTHREEWPYSKRFPGPCMVGDCRCRRFTPWRAVKKP